MQWWSAGILLFSILIVLLAIGLPVAFAFAAANMLAVCLIWGVTNGLNLLTLSIYDSVSNFSFLPVPLFILLGEVMMRSGIASRVINVLDEWAGRLPGRLALLAVAAGTLFATLSGLSMASVAMLGTVLVPEMERHGYKKPMTVGPIMGSAGLAIMIPPSVLAVILGGLAKISVGQVLVSTIVPGITMALFYAVYIVLRCWLQPSLAPPYIVPSTPLAKKVLHAIRDIVPLGLIFFLVVGLLFLGVASPSESAAFGCLGAFLLALLYKGLSWAVLKESMTSTFQLTVMSFMIITGSIAFSQVLAYIGVTAGVAQVVVNLSLSPMMTLIAMQVILLILGCLIDAVSITMVTIPIFMPLVHALGLNPVWFAAIMLLNLEMAGTTPPFGMTLFVMKGVSSPDTTMGDLYLAGLPFLGLNAIIMILMMFFPAFTLWLPSVMR